MLGPRSDVIVAAESVASCDGFLFLATFVISNTVELQFNEVIVATGVIG